MYYNSAINGTARSGTDQATRTTRTTFGLSARCSLPHDTPECNVPPPATTLGMFVLSIVVDTADNKTQIAPETPPPIGVNGSHSTAELTLLLHSPPTR